MHWDAYHGSPDNRKENIAYFFRDGRDNPAQLLMTE